MCGATYERVGVTLDDGQQFGLVEIIAGRLPHPAQVSRQVALEWRDEAGPIHLGNLEQVLDLDDRDEAKHEEARDEGDVDHAVIAAVLAGERLRHHDQGLSTRGGERAARSS